MNTKRSLYNVKTKGGLFNIKINPADRIAFKVAAELRGATMSQLIHQYIFRYIREVKTEMPEEFEARLAEVLADKASDEMDEFILSPNADEDIPVTQKGGAR